MELWNWLAEWETVAFIAGPDEHISKFMVQTCCDYIGALIILVNLAENPKLVYEMYKYLLFLGIKGGFIGQKPSLIKNHCKT